MNNQMRRGTTPLATFECDVNLDGWQVFVTFEQGEQELTYTGDDVAVTADGDDACVVQVQMSQQDTLSFNTGGAQAQIRAYKGGGAVASTVFYFDVLPILKEGVIP